MLRDQLTIAKNFIAEELEVRKASMLPATGKDAEYVQSATVALSAIEEAASMVATLMHFLIRGHTLMPLGTAIRAQWVDRVTDIIAKAEGR